MCFFSKLLIFPILIIFVFVFANMGPYGSEHFKMLLLSQFSTDLTEFRDRYPDDDGILVFKLLRDLTIIKKILWILKTFEFWTLNLSMWGRRFQNATLTVFIWFQPTRFMIHTLVMRGFYVFFFFLAICEIFKNCWHFEILTWESMRNRKISSAAT